LANEGATADISSALVTAMLCSPLLCHYLYISILLRNSGCYFGNLLEKRLLLASCSMVRWSRSSQCCQLVYIQSKF